MFVDTNYFFRFLFKDIKNQYLEAETLFLSASEREVSLITSTIVFFELYWVLKSYYEKNKSEIIQVLLKVLSFNFIEFKERELLLNALSLFQKKSLDLEDCYNIYYCRSKGIKTGSLKTFDKKLEREFNRMK